MIQKVSFGTLPDGREVLEYRIENRNGMRVSILSYGAILKECRVPSAKGDSLDVVLGYSTLEDYLCSRDYLGAIAGRVAGRIPEGRLQIDGQEYALVTNDGRNHLHGGYEGLDRKLWEEVDVDDSHLRLRYLSPDGEEGYPGEVDFLISYQLTDRNELVVSSRIESETRTPASLTQHSYFNLSGRPEQTVHDHRIQVFAQERAPVDKDMTPLCRWESVMNTPADLNHCTPLGERIPQLDGEHGDCYRVRRSRVGDLVPAARAWHPVSGIILNVATTEECVQFYTGKHLSSPRPGKHGKPHIPFSGFCLECQGYPAAFDLPGFQSILLHPGRPVRNQTVYGFSDTGRNSCCL